MGGGRLSTRVRMALKRRPQFTLSTVLIASILSGGLIWLNGRETVFDQSQGSTWYLPYDTDQRFFPSRGWPWPWEITCLQEVKPADSYRVQLLPLRIYRNLSYNIAVCLVLLIVGTIAIEWLIRHIKRQDKTK
jgi:hypothetical protein